MSNLVENGGFLGDADRWTLSGTPPVYVHNVGHNELGCVETKGVSDYVEGMFTIMRGTKYMVDVFARKVGDSAGQLLIIILKLDGTTVVYSSPSPISVSGEAFENVAGFRVGLPDGTYKVRLFSFGSHGMYIDDVSVAYVPKTRMELADEAAALLGDLATADAQYATTANGENTEGDYTQAVDAALRTVGAVNQRGEPDVRYLDEDVVDVVVDEVQRYMLNKLHRYYARHATDFSLEGRTESWNQRVKSIENLLGISVGGRPSASGRGIQQRKLTHRR